MQCPTCTRVVPEGALACAYCETDLGGLVTRPASSAPPPDSELLRFAPGTSFAERFTIIERTGSGGMGAVYKAIDRRVGEEIALKLLRPALARVPEYVERFKREVRVTRQISHANVCRVHDLGESEGILYLSMEWIRGETLRDLLRHAGKLDEARSLEIAEKIASALEAAHGHGVVHRDLKPGNIMIDDRGEVLVLDFGIATESGGDDLTQTDVVHGTPQYMSPEQRRGAPVDARSDLYSLGLILEEMLGGRGRGAASPATAAILAWLLAEDPERRYRSATDAARALHAARGKKQQHWTVSVGANRFALALWSVPIAILLVAAAPRIPRAVDRVREIFGDRTTTADINYRRGMQFLREESETGLSLDEAILKFRRAVEADSMYARAWAGLGEAYWMRFERKREDSSRQEAEDAVNRALRLDPGSAEARNAHAFGLVMQGRNDEARKELRALTKEKPRFDQAWANLGRACRGSKNFYEEGLGALERATRLNPVSFRYQVHLGNFHESYGERDEAIRAYRHAIDLKPNSPTAWLNLGASYLRAGKLSEAVHALEQSLHFGSDRPATRANLGTAYFFLKDYDKAAENYQQAAALDPADPIHYANLGDALRMLGKDEQAVTAYREAAERARRRIALTPDDPRALMDLALLCARSRDGESALRDAGEALAKQPDDPDLLLKNAILRAVLGQDDVALECLEKATRRGLGRAQIENEPDLARLRANPRFQRIVELAS